MKIINWFKCLVNGCVFEYQKSNTNKYARECKNCGKKQHSYFVRDGDWNLYWKDSD